MHMQIVQRQRAQKPFEILLVDVEFAFIFRARCSCWLVSPLAIHSHWTVYFKLVIIFQGQFNLHPLTDDAVVATVAAAAVCLSRCRQLNRELMRRVHRDCVKLREIACWMRCCCSFCFIINLQTLVLRSWSILSFGILNVHAAIRGFERTHANQFGRCVIECKESHSPCDRALHRALSDFIVLIRWVGEPIGKGYSRFRLLALARSRRYALST